MRLVFLSIAITISSGCSWIFPGRNICTSLSAERYDGIVFDAYGTLLDVSSVPTFRASNLNLPPDFSKLWREKQLSYTWLRTSMNRYIDFLQVTEDALDHALAFYNRTLTFTDRTYLLDSWYHLKPFPDVQTGLERLKSQGHVLYILSNGTPRMLSTVLSNTGLLPYFRKVVSVDPVREFKPSPKVYAWLQESICIPRDKILFVSSNSWDDAGAKSYGFKTVWINRNNGTIDVLQYPPDFYFTQLLQLVQATS